MPRISKQDRAQAIETLRGILKPGDTVYTTLRHVSPSGMSRTLGVHFIGEDRSPRWLSRLAWVAGAANGWDEKREGAKMGGCGMDMGFALVYNLGAILWPKGTDTPHGMRNGEPDSCGGYALNHRWL